jgi:hypothetical protein
MQQQSESAMIHVPYNLLRSKLPGSPSTSLGSATEHIWTYQWLCGCVADGEDERALIVTACDSHQCLFH